MNRQVNVACSQLQEKVFVFKCSNWEPIHGHPHQIIFLGESYLYNANRTNFPNRRLLLTYAKAA